MKIKATILPATGKREYAILRWDDYQALLSAAGDDAIDGAILDSLPAYDRKDLLPGELVRLIIGGKIPIAVLVRTPGHQAVGSCQGYRRKSRLYLRHHRRQKTWLGGRSQKNRNRPWRDRRQYLVRGFQLSHPMTNPLCVIGFDLHTTGKHSERDHAKRRRAVYRCRRH